MATPILQANGLTAGYGDHVVLRDLEVTFAKQQICAVVGPNGAGKTTLLKCLYGLMAPQRGRVTLDGEVLANASPKLRLAMGLAYVSQERNVFSTLTVVENLTLALTALQVSSQELARRMRSVLELFPRLQDRKGQVVGTMSGGEQRMVAIGMGLMTEPRLLLLDEPTTGLAPSVVHQLMTVIQRLNSERGITTVVVEQNILSLLKIAHSLVVLKNGRCAVYPGPPSSISKEDLIGIL